ncbi:PelD GGDEF domain-containing protein [Marinobacter sp. KMM 10035]|uniref:PelD GGDEF domain-containing protein n=1 Tax=Marinobacter sp. KMM 10035 TaxID=3134034 RepID=UPI00397A2095
MTTSDVYGDLNLASKDTAAWVKWLETLVITGVFIGVAFWQHPEDPLLISGEFPWLALATLIAGLRYGFLMALVSSTLILATGGLFLRADLLPVTAPPYIWGVGVMGVGLLAGEFRDYWDRRIEKLVAANQYRHTRLEEFTRNFYLLKVSHDRLEQQLAGNSNSLREALRRLDSEISHAQGTGLNRETGELMMRLLVRYGQLQVAGIYTVSEGKLAERPVASIGSFQPAQTDDPILVHALQEQQLVSVHTEHRENRNSMETNLLLALPLINSENTMVGMVTVQAMPFFSFQPKTLRLLAIMAGHMADMIQEHAKVPGQPIADWRRFEFQLARVASDARNHKLSSMVIHFTFTDTATAVQITQRMQRMRRGLDVIAFPPEAPETQLVILLPLTDELGGASYLQRLTDDIRQHSGESLQSIARIQKYLVGPKSNVPEWLDRVQKAPK